MMAVVEHSMYGTVTGVTVAVIICMPRMLCATWCTLSRSGRWSMLETSQRCIVCTTVIMSSEVMLHTTM